MPSPKVCSKPAAALAVSLFALASSASAVVHCNSAAPMPFVVPATTQGVYVNLVTGTFGLTPGASVGWEFNPWGSSLGFFFPSTPAASFGGVGSGTVYSVLNSGTTIGPASTFITTVGGGATWDAGQTGKYFGIKFFNEATSSINYGWVQIDSTAATGHPATIRGYCYQDSGAAIDAGTLPVELQSFSVE